MAEHPSARLPSARLPSSTASSTSELPSLEELFQEQPAMGSKRKRVPGQDGGGEESSIARNVKIIRIADSSDSDGDGESNGNSDGNGNGNGNGSSNSGSNGSNRNSNSNSSNSSNGSSNGGDGDGDHGHGGDDADDGDDNHGFIPHLDSISAAIFVPIPASTNLLSPPGFSPNSPEYHRAALDVVARHEARVRDNLEALFQREMLRISIDAPAANSDFDYFAATAAVRARGEAALRRDCEAMLANMREPDGPSVQHNVNVIPTPKMDSVPVTYAPIMSPRELAARDVMKVIAAATQELSGFDNHVKCMRDAIKKQIQQSALQIGSQSDPMDID